MSTLHDIRHDISRAWHQVRDGWTRRLDQASGAITRFTHKDKAEVPRQSGGALDPWGGSHRMGWGTAHGSGGWGLLAADVSDDGDRLIVRIEAPGMEKGDFDLRVEHGDLVVRGEKHVAHEQSMGRLHVSECAYGLFERVIPLPDAVLSERATATYRHGVLRVELPKDASQRHEPIQVAVR
jgi:HSP20 family protein